MLSTEPGNSPNFHRTIRAEFPLPALEQVRRRFSERMEDTEPVMQQLVRVVMPYFHSPNQGKASVRNRTGELVGWLPGCDLCKLTKAL